jgi:uncharacterized protein YecE (DUF72 family)
MSPPLIGTAGWSIPRAIADRFPGAGTGLERYAAGFPVVEINSSFHRPHRLSTWGRWRDSTPAGFRFSVKLPKTITHVRKLVDCDNEITAFLDQAHVLGGKLSVLLVQLPPKLEFDPRIVSEFFDRLRSRTAAPVACEPRHLTWFSPAAGQLLGDLQIARVAADPSICDEAAIPGGWSRLRYWRLHGSPVVYRSSYADRIDALAAAISREDTGKSWCIFDNTASSAGAADALLLKSALASPDAAEQSQDIGR